MPFPPARVENIALGALSRIFLYTGSRSSEIKNMIYSSIKCMEYLGINQTKDEQDLHPERYKALLRDMKEGPK